MKRLSAGLLAVLASTALLSGCASELSPEEKLRDLTAALVQAADDRDPSGLRVAAEDLQAEVDSQERSGQLTANNATVLSRQIALLVKNADLLTATAAPTVSPTPSLSPTPSPTPSQSPTPSPTPSLSPTPSPTPSEAPPPTQEPTPTITLGLGEPSPQPSATP